MFELAGGVGENKSLLFDIGDTRDQVSCRVVTEHSSQGWINVNITAMRRSLENAFRGILENAAKFSFCLSQRFGHSDSLDGAAAGIRKCLQERQIFPGICLGRVALN